MSNDGGPAFARQNIRDPETGEMEYGHEGMTLRDYFAAKALQGWLASFAGNDAGHPAERGPYAANIAGLSYKMADAMLAAREQKGETPRG